MKVITLIEQFQIGPWLQRQFLLFLIFINNMRTLSNLQKVKNTQPNKQGEKKQLQKKDQKQSKKIMKTIFHSPFRYKIQTLNQEDSQIVLSLLIKYAQTLRAEFGSEVKSVKNEKFISFNSKVKLLKPTLSVQHLVYGIKQCKNKLKTNSIKLPILFYDENKHDTFEQLLCNIIYYKSPYIVLRDSQRLKDELGIKQLLALGLTKQEFANDLSSYCSRCLIQIPWVVDHKWIPLV